MERIEDRKEDRELSGYLTGLPHGEGFRFLDRLTELEPGESGCGEWDVTGDEAFFDGHFPGNPVVPGVIMIEALAQLAGVVAQARGEMNAAEGEEAKGEDGGGVLMLTGVRSVKIVGTAGPGAILEIRAKISGRLGDMVMGSGTVSTGGKELMRGEVMLVGSVGSQ